MKSLIENYRGFEISFDTEKEVFYSFGDSYDKEFSNKSYAAAKKAIDDHIKINSEFKPFYVSDKKGEQRKIVGIRKDGRFVDENKDQISEFSEDNFCKVDAETEEAVDKTKAIHFEVNKLYESIRLKNKNMEEIWQSISHKSLKAIKSQYIQP